MRRRSAHGRARAATHAAALDASYPSCALNARKCEFRSGAAPWIPIVPAARLASGVARRRLCDAVAPRSESGPPPTFHLPSRAEPSRAVKRCMLCARSHGHSSDAHNVPTPMRTDSSKRFLAHTTALAGRTPRLPGRSQMYACVRTRVHVCAHAHSGTHAPRALRHR